MKCPNCGATMKDGHMYCEVCGNEIQIVPEFEPEIENSIHKTLSDVANEIQINRDSPHEEEEEIQNLSDETVSRGGNKKAVRKKGKKLPFIMAGVLFLIAVACLYGFWSNQPNELYQKAMEQMEDGAYEAALASFENAVKRSTGNAIYLSGMADCCMAMGDEARAREISFDILQLDSENEEAYARLIKIYKNQDAYEEIDELLQNCESRDIRNLYLDYMANAPSFDMESGTYREKITVKLIANASGTLYYTLDGSAPTVNSEVYTTPLSLESGNFTIKALFINQYGVMSDVATAQYLIDVSKPDAPVVSPESGEYNKPGYISVEVPENCKVYYTTDGTVPTTTSSIYEQPFWMPAGNSAFNFIVCDEGGICGDVTYRQYNLNLNAALGMEAAANQLLLTLKNAGILINLHGDVADKKGRNIYTYKYTLSIGENNYYLYREYYEETSGNSNVTGNDYVVNYMTGECYRAIRNEDQTYELIPVTNAAEEKKVQGSQT